MKVVEMKLEVHENVVASLEEHLAAAKAGHIVGFAIAYEVSGGATGHWTSFGVGCRPMTILGQLHAVAASMAARLNAEEES